MNRLIKTFGRKKSRTLSTAQKTALTFEKYFIFSHLENVCATTNDLQTTITHNTTNPYKNNDENTNNNNNAKFEHHTTTNITNDITDFKKKFNNYNKLWLEIGFGFGDNLIENAKQNPDTYVIGCEPFMNAIAYVCEKANENHLLNIGIFKSDVRLILKYLSNISRIDILFPDPWPKKRHNKRRLFNYEFLQILVEKLNDDGEIFFATDCLSYIESAIQTCKEYNDKHSNSLSFQCDLKQLQIKPKQLLVQTKYESKAVNDKYYLNIKLNT